MYVPDIIKKKRDGKAVSREEMNYLISEFTKDNIPDYQMSAFLMAAFLKGLDDRETFYLTETMMNSGEIYDFNDIEGIKADKHSTGGVGDKISIPLAPLLACLGFYVPMVSGRGLGHTGGTLDKLESIEGFNVNLSKQAFKRILKKTGVVMGGQTEKFVPADKRLYALRDVTGTVESIQLITASIMSKKMSEGIDSLILDVKTGNGAFMKTEKDAVVLADSMFAIGEYFRKKIVYMITDMNQVLGDYAGNGAEIIETIDILKNGLKNAAYELMKETAVNLLLVNSMAESREEAMQKVDREIESGKAYDKFLQMVKAQGGNTASLTLRHLLHEKSFTVKAQKSGYIKSMDTYRTGIALIYLNAGRMKKTDRIDHKAGLRMHRHISDRVHKGDDIMTVYYNDRYEEAKNILQQVVEISDRKTVKTKLIKKVRGI